METVYRDYAPKGVQFFYLYKALAHPGLHAYVTPVTLEERLMQIKEARRTLGTEIPWVCDTMSNELKHATGDAPNSEYLLDPEGKIVRKRGWSDPDALRKGLEKLVGPVENPTKVSDLNLKVEPPPKHAPTGIVPRVELPERYLALRIEPQLQKLQKSKEPFYVIIYKLRVEADGNFLRSGKGKLYLGFHLDPLYGVHWNNLVAPVQYEFHPPGGVQISPSKGQGPKVEAEADADPREFLVDADGGNSKEAAARIVFRYFACSEQWCKPVTQEYVVRWEVDPDGGAAARRPAGSEGQSARPKSF